MVSTLSTLIQHSALNLRAMMQERNKRDTNSKERSQLFLLADDTIIYSKNPKELTKNS
jgi:hypothetical protein